MDVNQIFKDLSVLVHEQGDIVGECSIFKPLLLLLLSLFYPRVYNVRGLKTERIKTAEMTRGPECHQ